MVAWGRTRDWRELQKRRHQREERSAQPGQQAPGQASGNACDNVSSTCISAMKRADDGAMTLTFQSGGTYVYFGVSEETFDAFCNADSKGRFFHANVRGRYPFTKTR
jgi:KTSC domain